MKRRKMFNPLKAQETLKERAVNLLTNAILSGRIKPGERLNESHLARDLRVSRAPIREALQQLQEQGLVVSVPRRGMFVVSLEPDDVQKINSIRVILEGEALRLARRHTTPQALEKLKQMVQELESLDGASPDQQTKADFEFHRAIWRLSGNHYLEKTLHDLTAPLLAHAMLNNVRSDKRRAVLLSHRPLLDFVLGVSTQPAEEIMITHLSLPWDDPARFSSFEEQPSRSPDSG